MNPNQQRLDGSTVGALHEIRLTVKRPPEIENHPDDYETIEDKRERTTTLLRYAQDGRAALRELADTMPDLPEDWTEIVVKVKPKGDK